MPSARASFAPLSQYVSAAKKSRDTYDGGWLHSPDSTLFASALEVSEGSISDTMSDSIIARARLTLSNASVGVPSTCATQRHSAT